jgi:hypothetical protein
MLIKTPDAMKSKLLIIFLLTSLFSYGQQYERLVDTTKLWSTLFHGEPPWNGLITYFEKFSGDTLIGSDHYLKIYRSSPSTQNYHETGYIREDSNNKVYYRNLTGTQSGMIYDFNVGVGDTVVAWGTTLVADTVDSVNIGNVLRKRIHFPMGWAGESWIEGIGSMHGILGGSSLYIVGGSLHFLCYFKNDSLICHNNLDTLSLCEYNTEGISTLISDHTSVNIYPNPVTSTSFLRIEGKQDATFLLEIYSPLGERIKNLAIQGEEEVILHKSDFAAGMYLYRLLSQDSGGIVAGKFIVE